MNGHTTIDTFEATEHLKTILNVGKSDSESGKLTISSNGTMEASGDGNLMLHNRSYQKISLCANKDNSHVTIYGNDVEIYSSPLEVGATCSQVMVENMVDYGWEEKYYFGKLISVHLSGKYIAYVLRRPNTLSGYVRLLRTQFNLRHLIKDFKHEVKDIAFAHTNSQVLLGSVDASGELLVHNITDDESRILCNLVIRIVRPDDWTPSEYNRIIWCLYIPDDNEDDTASDDASSLLVVTHNEKAEILNIDTIIKQYGHGNLKTDELKDGIQIINDHKMPITAATFSPDGTALAIASLDGVVNFFQVDTPEKDSSPRCLHHWTPHDEKSLSCLYFLDNHKNHRPDVQFWRFAVTGADNNTELKLWSCESWKCLQTIRIYRNSDDTIEPQLKAEIDLSSKHLFLSDITRKVLLIFMIQQDPINGSAMFCSLSEYRMPYAILSLAISNISCVKCIASEDKNSDDEGEKEQVGDITNDLEETRKYLLKLFWIQTKALQACTIFYEPEIDSPLLSAGSISSLSQDSYIYKDGLSDISLELRDTLNRSGKDLDVSLQKCLHAVDELSIDSQSTSNSLTALTSHISTYPNCSEVLLTPDDFTSPSHSNLAAANSFSHHEEIVNTVPKCDPDTQLSDGSEVIPEEGNTLQRRKSSQHSSTSSPSREVAEILAPAKVLHLNEIENDAPSLTIKDEVETLSNGLDNYKLSVGGISINQQEYLMKDWPQAPDPNKNYRISTVKESELLGPTHFQRDSGESSNISLENSKFIKFNNSMNEILQQVSSLSGILNDQRCEIQSMQNEIKLLRQEQTFNQQNQLDKVLSNKLESIVSQTVVPHYSRLENLILKKAEEERRRTEREFNTLSNEVSTTYINKFDSMFKQELSSNIIPQINRVFDTVTQKIQTDFNQKLSAIDTSLRESFTRHIKGKAFTDGVAQTISTTVQGVVQSACKEIFQNSVVPSFEKACQHLFQQLNDTFYKGTIDYMQVFERCSQKSCSSLETTVGSFKEEVNRIIADSQETTKAQNLKYETYNSDMMKQQEMLLPNISRIVQEETKKVFREHQTAVLNSRSTTPVPLSDPQLQKQHLMQLVRQGNINDAFQEALSAMDVQLVLFLCESVNCDQVFGPTPCPLQQHVLLSLVNQLSADLSVKTDIKVRYIEEVIASLDSNNPIIREHIRSVLENLQQRIANFMVRNPTHRLSRCLKRISLAVSSLIK